VKGLAEREDGFGDHDRTRRISGLAGCVGAMPSMGGISCALYMHIEDACLSEHGVRARMKDRNLREELQHLVLLDRVA
jgi:hypothetical protein